MFHVKEKKLCQKKSMFDKTFIHRKHCAYTNYQNKVCQGEPNKNWYSRYNIDVYKSVASDACNNYTI